MSSGKTSSAPASTLALLEAIRSGQSPASVDAAYWALWLRYRPLVVAAVRRWRVPAGTDPEDFRIRVLETVEYRARSAFRVFRRECPIEAYLRRIARRAFLDEYRKWSNRGARAISLSGIEDIINDISNGGDHSHRWMDPLAQAEQQDLSDKLDHALARVGAHSSRSLRVMRAVRLRIAEDMPRSYVAREIGISERQVDRYVREGLAQLKTLLQTLGLGVPSVTVREVSAAPNALVANWTPSTSP